MKIVSVFRLLFITSFLCQSCLDSSLEVTNSVTGGQIDYLNDIDGSPNLINDPYRIVGITPTGGRWKVIIEYSGGCNAHNFTVLTNVPDSSRNPSIRLFHDANVDLCEAAIRDTLIIDMRTALNDLSLLSETTVDVTNPSNGRTIPIDPWIAQLSQGVNCEHEASTRETSCNSGIWENEWLLLSESHPEYDQVWLQPVSNSIDVQLQNPELGDFEIGITLLFGYVDYDEVCSNPPSGLIVPVSINCLSED